MLTGVHLLLTYTCLYECDHCFLHCSPRAQGTFTLDQVEQLIDQAVAAGCDNLYFEGGEPFLYYPLLLEALRLTKARGLTAGVVTNAYWGHSERDAELWLMPLADVGIDDLSVSDDGFHSANPKQSPAAVVRRVAQRLGLPVGAICIDAPVVAPKPEQAGDRAVIGGDVLFKGRAAETLTEGLPRQSAGSFDRCPHEQLEAPGRVHVDSFGNVFVCQGLSVGNVWELPLAAIMERYQPAAHPIVGPLLAGGPARLATLAGLADTESYVDHCHLCYLARKALTARFPETLCPEQVYGLETND